MNEDKNMIMYEQYLRDRITELRIKKGVSEHRMSLDLGKNASYIRGISNGRAMPSVQELFNIIDYFDLTPAQFFSGFENSRSLRIILSEKMLELNDDDLIKVSTFLDWILK